MNLDTSSVFVIAEAGVNHNGSLDLALELVEAANDAGADAVKFQTFRAENLVSKFATKADYQKKTTDTSQSQLEMLKQLELNEQAHRRIIEHCEKYDIRFMSSPFDHESLKLLVNIFDLPLLKFGSGELTNAQLLLEAARTGKPMILSTGMSTLKDIEDALSVLAFGYLNDRRQPSLQAFRKAFDDQEGKDVLKRNVTLLHCTTEYPAPFGEVNLLAMDVLKSTFGLTVGYSDHTKGYSMPVAAVARGARVIEKHFTLDRSLPGPDHKASLEPKELKEMVRAIRQVELGLGQSAKEPTASEIANMKVARKSLIASRPIKAGEHFSEENIVVKRPGDGIPPIKFWEYLGKKSEQDYAEDEVIKK